MARSSVVCHACLGERGPCGERTAPRCRCRSSPSRAGGREPHAAAAAPWRSPAFGASAEDEKAIKQVAEAFIRAFNAGDAKAVAALYTDDAELIDEYGERIEGRPTIQDFYTALFNERKGATIDDLAGVAPLSGPRRRQGDRPDARQSQRRASPRPTETTRSSM